MTTALSLSLPACGRWNPPAINQGRLEVIQWLAFAAMIVDHLGAFFFGNLAWMRSIGRLAFPLFALVFAWRLADMLNRNSQRGLLPMGQRLVVSGMCAQAIFWFMTVGLNEANVMFGFTLVLCIAALAERDRPWLGLGWPERLCLAAALFGFVAPHIDYNDSGILLMLGLYAYFRWHAVVGLIVAIGALSVLTLTSHYAHSAIFAVPVAVVLVGLRAPWIRLEKPVPHLFYWMYPLHLLIILVIFTVTALVTMK